MTFVYKGKKYTAPTALEIVRAIEKDSQGYSGAGGNLRDFLHWSLTGFSDEIHLRELSISSHVSDESLALNYLYLLDEHLIGAFSDTKETAT